MEKPAFIPARVTAFRHDEDGAVTVDWIVLTGAIVFMGVAIAITIGGELPVIAEKIAAFLANRELGI